jgi:hypothetical protein
MTLRYFYNLGIALVAGFIIVATQGWSSTTAGWLAFAAGIVFAVAGAAFGARRRSPVDIGFGGAASLLGVLMIIESLLASGSALTWLSFAGAAGVLGLAVIGLTIHELSTERVVHSLDVSPSRTTARAGLSS